MAEVTAAQHDTGSVEERAKLQGWRPQDEYSGDPKNFVGAQEYLDRGNNIAKQQTRKAGELEKQVQALQADIAELRQGNADFKNFHDQAMANQKAQREQLIRQLEGAQAKAIDDGKGGEAVNIGNQIQGLRAEQQQADAQAQQRAQQNQQLQAQQAVNENPWYRDNADLRAMADGLTAITLNELRTQRQAAGMPVVTPPIKELMSALRTKVAGMNPDHPAFTNTRRQESQRTGDDPASQGSGGGEGRGWDDLPKEDREVAERMIRTHGITKEAYLENYEWGAA